MQHFYHFINIRRIKITTYNPMVIIPKHYRVLTIHNKNFFIVVTIIKIIMIDHCFAIAANISHFVFNIYYTSFTHHLHP